VTHDLSSQLTGPLGGALALAFGAGCTAGWGFAHVFIIAEAKKRISKLESQVESLQGEVKNILRDQIRR